MATATIDNVAPNRQTRFPSRLIPGAHCSAVTPGRRKAASTVVDGRFWEWHEESDLFRSRKRPLWQSFLEAVLPQPSTRSQRSRLAMAVLTDIFAIIAGFVSLSAGFATFWQQGRTTPATPLSFVALPSSALSLLMLYGAVFTLLGYSERLYHPETIREPAQERLILVKVFVWSTVLVLTALALSSTREISIAQLAASAPISFLFMLAWRTQWRSMSEQEGRSRSYVRNVLIVGAGKLGRDLASRLEQDRPRRCTVRGFLDDREPAGGDVHGRGDDLARVARRYFVDEVILTISPETTIAQKVIWEARRNRIDVKIVPDMFGFDPAAVKLEKFGGIPVLTLCEEQIPTVGLLLKRFVDVTLSAVALILTAPVLVVLALAIKLDSPGPVLYRAARLGRKGQRFQCYKLRTMVADADQLKEKLRECNERHGAFFKITNDPRVTRVGRILRRYSLDELPQLWNVLRGEMSLVGPRPHPVDDFERYQLEDWQRLEITPGLTGLWQVTARRDPSFERGMSLDREYIEGWSLWMDFKIMCRTVLIVLRGEGT